MDLGMKKEMIMKIRSVILSALLVGCGASNSAVRSTVTGPITSAQTLAAGWFTNFPKKHGCFPVSLPEPTGNEVNGVATTWYSGYIGFKGDCVVQGWDCVEVVASPGDGKSVRAYVVGASCRPPAEPAPQALVEEADQPIEE